MYEVIICTISSGRIQRKRFNDSDTAWACADKWNEKNKNAKAYRVSVEIVTQASISTTKQFGRTAAM